MEGGYSSSIGGGKKRKAEEKDEQPNNLTRRKSEEIKRLYVFTFLHGSSGPNISHCLYAFDIPADPKLPADVMTQVRNPKPTSPILTFPSAWRPCPMPSGLTGFPDHMPMGFVELDSKFYFLGGEFGIWSTPSPGKDCKKALKECKKIHPTYPYSAKVYVFDPAKAKTQDKQPLDAGVLLGIENDGVFREVAAMTTGKHMLHAFVFDRKIYALGCSPNRAKGARVELEYFEVFNPRTNKWSILPEPVWGDANLLRGHAVIDKKLYVFVEYPCNRYQVYVFDLVKEKWIKQRRYSPEYLYWGIHVPVSG